MTYNLPIPAGVVAGDWYDVGGCGYPGDVSRMLTWSQHNVWRVHVAVVRAQSSALQTGFGWSRADPANQPGQLQSQYRAPKFVRLKIV